MRRRTPNVLTSLPVDIVRLFMHYITDLFDIYALYATGDAHLLRLVSFAANSVDVIAHHVYGRNRVSHLSSMRLFMPVRSDVYEVLSMMKQVYHLRVCLPHSNLARIIPTSPTFVTQLQSLSITNDIADPIKTRTIITALHDIARSNVFTSLHTLDIEMNKYWPHTLGVSSRGSSAPSPHFASLCPSLTRLRMYGIVLYDFSSELLPDTLLHANICIEAGRPVSALPKNLETLVIHFTELNSQFERTGVPDMRPSLLLPVETLMDILHALPDSLTSLSLEHGHHTLPIINRASQLQPHTAVTRLPTALVRMCIGRNVSNMLQFDAVLSRHHDPPITMCTPVTRAEPGRVCKSCIITHRHMTSVLKTADEQQQQQPPPTLKLNLPCISLPTNLSLVLQSETLTHLHITHSTCEAHVSTMVTLTKSETINMPSLKSLHIDLVDKAHARSELFILFEPVGLNSGAPNLTELRLYRCILTPSSFLQLPTHLHDLSLNECVVIAPTEQYMVRHSAETRVSYRQAKYRNARGITIQTSNSICCQFRERVEGETNVNYDVHRLCKTGPKFRTVDSLPIIIGFMPRLVDIKLAQYSPNVCPLHDIPSDIIRPYATLYSIGSAHHHH